MVSFNPHVLHGFILPPYAHRISFSLFMLTGFPSSSLCSQGFPLTLYAHRIPSASLCSQGFLLLLYAHRVFFRLVMLTGFPSASLYSQGFLLPPYDVMVSFHLFMLTGFPSASLYSQGFIQASLCSMVLFVWTPFNKLGRIYGKEIDERAKKSPSFSC